MKSVFSMFIIFIGLYLILASGVIDFFAQKTFLKIALGSVVFMLILFAALVGTPYSKPLFKRRVKNDDEK